MHSMNLAFLIKLGWRLISKKYHFWAKVLIHKYIRGEVAFSKLVRKQNSSNVWRGLTATATLLLQGSQCNTPKYTLVVWNIFRIFCRYNLFFL